MPRAIPRKPRAGRPPILAARATDVPAARELEALRAGAGIPIRAWCAALGVSRDAYERWISGASAPVHLPAILAAAQAAARRRPWVSPPYGRNFGKSEKRS